jgi:hypothetical protein
VRILEPRGKRCALDGCLWQVERGSRWCGEAHRRIGEEEQRRARQPREGRKLCRRDGCIEMVDAWARTWPYCSRVCEWVDKRTMVERVKGADAAEESVPWVRSPNRKVRWRSVVRDLVRLQEH